jgi:hypothetical protein
MASRGYADLDHDDYEAGTLLDRLQRIADTANHRQIVSYQHVLPLQIVIQSLANASNLSACKVK